jgi:hypothetical protein
MAENAGHMRVPAVAFKFEDFAIHCSFNRVIRHRTFVPGAIFADFSMARQAGLRVTG